MSVPCKYERSLLSHEEYETIRLTHHPAIYDVEVAELEAMRPRLRKMRDKERTLGRQKRREGRGKAEARGTSFPGTAEHASERKQAFAAALKRVNTELRRLHNLAARTANVEAARKALALHRAANFMTIPSRSDRERRHGADGEQTPKNDHCRSRNRTSVPGDESRSGCARRARWMIPEVCSCH